MFMFWVDTVVGIVLYAIFGYVAITATHRYLDEMTEKVTSIENGYVYGLKEKIVNGTRFRLRKPTAWKINALSVAVVVFWPISCFYMIIKAERAYWDIQKEIFKRNELVR